MVRNPRVLVIAEAANPEWTSVPLIGWKLARALSSVADVHLVTHVRNRDAITRQGLVEGRDFTAIDNEIFAARLSRLAELLGGRSGKGWTTRTAFATLAYYSFESEVWRQFADRLKSNEFDLVHRVTPVSPTSPSILAKRLSAIGVPFVLGPLNGGIPWPKNFIDVQHAEREWLSHLRGLFKLLPGYRATRRYSSAILVGSKYTLSEMPQASLHKCVYIPENAVDGCDPDPEIRQPGGPLTAAFVGRLVPYKGADILIEAAADLLSAGRLRLDIVGDGPQRAALEHLVDRLGVGHGVRMHGWLSHAQAQQILQQSDVFAFPSIREFGGGVVVEAMSHAVPAIVADYGGPSELVDDLTGIRVPFTDRQSLIAGFREALSDVAQSPDKLTSFGLAARQKVAAQFTWDAKARQIREVYQAVLAKTDDLGSLKIGLT